MQVKELFDSIAPQNAENSTVANSLPLFLKYSVKCLFFKRLYQIVENLKYVGVKANALGTALSYGIAKTKVKVEFAGTTSPYVFIGKAHFRMHFGMVPASKAQRLYMFSSNYTLRDFAVSRFVVKKNKRQLVQGSYSLWGGNNSGLETADDVVVSSTKLKEGVYDVMVNAKPGEYCIVFTINGVGAYTSVFDFTIK